MLGEANKGFGIFGRTAGYYGVSEAQGRGTLHCHYVVWLKGAGTSDGLRAAIDREGENGPLRKKLLEFYDLIISTAIDMTAPEPEVPPEYCMPPVLDIPTDAESAAEYRSALKADAERVARKSNMHLEAHTFTCFKGNKQVCRFGFPKECIAASTFDDKLGGVVGRRDHPYLNSYNPFIASVLRCNHDVK